MAETGRKVQTVDNALRLVMRLAEPPGVWSVTQLSKDLGLSKSVTHSLLATLRSWGVVAQDPDNRYRLGLQLLVLGQAVQERLALRTLALPVLQRLAAVSEESAYLMVLSEEKGTLVERIDPPNPVRVTMKVGQQGDLHAGSSHKVMLAFLPPDRIERYLQTHPLPRLTARTTTDPDVLRRQLTEIRALGYAYTEQESFEGIAGLAAPIFDRNGQVVASIGLAALVQRLRPRRAQLAPVVMEAAAEISRALGHGLGLAAPRANGDGCM